MSYAINHKVEGTDAELASDLLWLREELKKVREENDRLKLELSRRGQILAVIANLARIAAAEEQDDR